MDFNKYLKDLESDKETIFRLQEKYYNLFRQHMKKKKKDRDSSWDKSRSMLFHISGVLSMLASGVRRWTEIK